MERDLKKDIEEGLYKNKDNIASLIPYSFEGVSYALQINASPILRKTIATAILKFKYNEECFEEIFNKIDTDQYSDKNSISNHEIIRHLVIENSVFSNKIINDFYNHHRKNIDLDSGKGIFCISMSRLVTSFKSAVLLLNNGFYIEVSSIYRLILEQLAWGCYLLQEEDREKIINNRTQNNVKYLKMVLGDSYGKLYGYLSSEAHLEPKEIGKYISFTDSEISIKDRSGKECEEDTITLISLLKAYAEVIWYGMNQIKIMEDEKKYYEDWYNVNKYFITYCFKALNGEIKFKVER